MKFHDINTGDIVTVTVHDAEALRRHFDGAPAGFLKLVSGVADGLENGILPDSDTLTPLGLEWADEFDGETLPDPDTLIVRT